MPILHRQRTIRSRCTVIARVFNDLLEYDTHHPATISAKTHAALLQAQADLSTSAATFAALVAIPHS